MPVTGGEEINRNLRRIIRTVNAEVVEQLDENAEDLLGRARGLAPQLTGALIGRGAIARRGRRDVVSRIIFFDSPYAVRRHEDFYNLGPLSRLKRSADGPIGRKYLERPFVANVDRYVNALGDAVNRGLRLGVR